MGRPMLAESAVRDRLRRHLGALDLIPAATATIECSQLAGGYSHETWRVRAGELDVVMKIATGDGPLAHYDIEAEARATARAAAAGVPTAHVLASTNDPNVIGAPFMLSDYVAGSVPSVGTIVAWLDAGGPDFRERCARSVVDVLVRLGGAQPEDAIPPALDQHYGQHLAEAVAELRHACDGLLEVPPSIIVAHEWLVERLGALAGDRAGLTHGDFRIGNLIFHGAEVAAVVDWERAGWGHPLYDLGYLALPGMRHGDRIGGVVTEQELRELWVTATGEELNLERVAYFRCMAIFTELVNCVRALVNYSQGRGRTSLLRIVPLVVRLENDVLHAMERIDAGDLAL